MKDSIYMKNNIMTPDRAKMTPEEKVVYYRQKKRERRKEKEHSTRVQYLNTLLPSRTHQSISVVV